MTNYSVNESIASPETVTPSDFCSFVPNACLVFMAHFTPTVKKIIPDRIGPAPSRTSKRLNDVENKSGTSNMEIKSLNDVSNKPPNIKKNQIDIHAIYNTDDALVQIKIPRNPITTSLLLKIITLALPYHPRLTSLVYGYANQFIISEIKNQLDVSHVTQVCLDATFVPQANYHVLLDGPNELENLSLSRCSLNDSFVKILAKKLFVGSPGAKTLSVLNLSSNKITDIGAKYLAEALRTNRKLNYLNLADNTITDIGANYIFNIFKIFPITDEELSELFIRELAYEQKHKGIDPSLLSANKSELSVKETKKKKKRKIEKDTASFGSNTRVGYSHKVHSGSRLALRLSVLAPFEDPYSMMETTQVDGAVCCQGNNTLCYLNLAYNNLTYFSVKALLEVFIYQRDVNRKPRGLINVTIDGNYIPISCAEYKIINSMIYEMISEQLNNNMAKKITRSINIKK